MPFKILGRRGRGGSIEANGFGDRGGRVAIDGNPPSIGDGAGADFDVTDRLAIINLFGAYAYTYYENRLDGFRTVFAESPQLVLLHEGRPLSADIHWAMSLHAIRKAGFNTANNHSR